MGYKPSFGAYSLTGVKGLAPSFDTLGVIARNVATLSRVHAILANTSPQQADISPRSPRAIGFCRTPWWGQAEPEMQNAMERTAERFAHLCPVKTIDLGAFEGSAKLHEAIMAFEAAQSLAAEWRAGREKLSAPLRLLVETGRGIALADHHAHLRQAEEARKRIADSFEEVDLFFAPAAPGAAPVGLSATGNPIFSRMWTLLRLPTVTIQLGLDPYGMPLGGQLLGAFGNDEALLGWTAWLEERLPSPASPDLSRYMN
jgi:Asp-tRNA(Asn)/Glu-tRNA(Gln) amidotransferase A subunit family amidase